jgi:HPt (histidine-containing phosphotransfer) domain-containing protein
MITSTLLKKFWRKIYSSSLTAAAPIGQSSTDHTDRAGQENPMHQGTVPVKSYDLSLLQELVGENTPAVREIVQKFVQDTPPEVDRLEKAVAANDLRAMSVQAHKLKGQLKLFGLESAAPSLILMEKVGKGEGLPSADQTLLQQHAEEVKAVFEGAIRELVKKYPTS